MWRRGKDKEEYWANISCPEGITLKKKNPTWSRKGRDYDKEEKKEPEVNITVCIRNGHNKLKGDT